MIKSYYEKLMDRICTLTDADIFSGAKKELDARKKKSRETETISQLERGNELFQVKYKVARCGDYKFWQFVKAR